MELPGLLFSSGAEYTDACIAECDVRAFVDLPHSAQTWQMRVWRACRSGDAHALRILLQAIVQRNVQVRGWNGAFLAACQADSAECMCALLELSGARRVDVHDDDEIALRWSAEMGHAAAVGVLLALTGDRAVHVNADACEALHSACSYGRADVVRLLLKRPDIAPNVNRAFQAAAYECTPERARAARYTAVLRPTPTPSLYAPAPVLTPGEEEACSGHLNCVRQLLAPPMHVPPPSTALQRRYGQVCYRASKAWTRSLSAWRACRVRLPFLYKQLRQRVLRNALRARVVAARAQWQRQLRSAKSVV